MDGCEERGEQDGGDPKGSATGVRGLKPGAQLQEAAHEGELDVTAEEKFLKQANQQEREKPGGAVLQDGAAMEQLQSKDECVCGAQKTYEKGYCRDAAKCAGEEVLQTTGGQAVNACASVLEPGEDEGGEDRGTGFGGFGKGDFKDMGLRGWEWAMVSGGAGLLGVELRLLLTMHFTLTASVEQSREEQGSQQQGDSEVKRNAPASAETERPEQDAVRGRRKAGFGWCVLMRDRGGLWAELHAT